MRPLTAKFLLLFVSGLHCESGGGERQSVVLSVVKVGQTSAVLRWFTGLPTTPEPVHCEVMYRPEHGVKMHVIESTFLRHNTSFDLEIDDLDQHTPYMVFISCSANKAMHRSNTVTFTTGVSKILPVSQIITTVNVIVADTDKECIVRPDKAKEETPATDIVLGILFGIFGAIIIATGAFYLWKKYQRRQQVLQFYRQASEVETNPFGTLHVYFDDVATNSNLV